jgi:hypothetical protein
MTEAWLIEIIKGIGKMFVNPLLYWMFFLLFFAGYKRIKQERVDFGFKVFDIFTEWKGTWALSLVSGIILSFLIIGIGIVFSYETILLLCVITILVSLTLNFKLLSAGYTIGITYFLLLFLPFLLDRQSYVDASLFSETNFTGISLLLGLFLVIEAILLKTIKRNASFPSIIIGNRGLPIGQHHLKRLAFIPFFALIPAGMITPYIPFWPYFTIGETSYSLIAVPFMIGVDYLVRGGLPQFVAARLAKATAYLAMVVLLIAIGSIFISWLSLAAVLVAILGKEWIRYNHKVKDQQHLAYFHPMNEGLKVLGVIPGSPADRLGILIGETISKVNGRKVSSVDTFYLALQESGATFKLAVLDDANEVRFIQSALYEGDHYELGLVFPTLPHRLTHKS